MLGSFDPVTSLRTGSHSERAAASQGPSGLKAFLKARSQNACYRMPKKLIFPQTHNLLVS